MNMDNSKEAQQARKQAHMVRAAVKRLNRKAKHGKRVSHSDMCSINWK